MATAVALLVIEPLLVVLTVVVPGMATLLKPLRMALRSRLMVLSARVRPTAGATLNLVSPPAKENASEAPQDVASMLAVSMAEIVRSLLIPDLRTELVLASPTTSAVVLI